MQKRTTNYSFQKFGDVFYSVNHNAGHLIDYVENDFKITNKSFDSSNSLFKSWNESKDDAKSIYLSSFGFKNEFKRDFHMFLSSAQIKLYFPWRNT